MIGTPRCPACGSILGFTDRSDRATGTAYIECNECQHRQMVSPAGWADPAMGVILSNGSDFAGSELSELKRRSS